MRTVAVAIAFLVSALSALGQGRVECNALPSAALHHPVRYCVLLPPSYDAQPSRRYPIVYFLHGLGDNEQSLVSSGAWNIAERLRETGKIGDMIIATPEGRSTFYINSLDGKVRYEDFFVREFIPTIEQRYRAARTRSGRSISGVSMGGYGALHFAFKYPQMFAAAAAQMPALYDRIPPALIAAAAPGSGMHALAAFGSPPSETFWRQNSPLTLARANAARLHRLRIYFDCGDQDDYGFDAGARSLDRILSANGVTHEFHIYPGRHDWTYVAAHFGEVLQFLWKAVKSN